MSTSLSLQGNKRDKSHLEFEVNSNRLVQITAVEIFCVNLGILSAISDRKFCFLVIVSEELLNVNVD